MTMPFRPLLCLLPVWLVTAAFGQIASPDITSFCPTAVSAGSGDVPLTITGTGFSQVVEVRWTSAAGTVVLPVQSSAAGQQGQTLTVIVPARLLAQPGAASISVVNVQQAVRVISFNAAQSQIGYRLSCVTENAFTVEITPGGTAASAPAPAPAQPPQLFETEVPAPPEGGYYTCTATAANGTKDSKTLFLAAPIIVRDAGTLRSPRPSAAAEHPRLNPVQFQILPAPAIRTVTPAPLSEGVTVALTVDGTNFIQPSASCGVTSRLFWNDVEIPATVVSGSRITATAPAALVQAGRARVNVSNPREVRSDTFFVDVTTQPEVLTTFLRDGVLGRPYPPTRISTAGGLPPFKFSLTPSIGLSIDPDTGVITGVPTREGLQEVIVSVVDGAQRAARRVYSLRVLPELSLSLSGLTATISTTDQQFVEVSIPNPYPAEIRGRLELGFRKDPAVAGPDDLRDPALRFGSSFPQFVDPQFTLLPGATRVRVPLQPGTAAGTIDVAVRDVSIEGDAVDVGDVRASTRVEATAPLVAACIEQKFAGLLRVRVTGSSPTREIRRITFRFTPRPGSNLETTEIQRDDAGTALFDSFYNPSGGLPPRFGEFVYTQDFQVDGDVNDITSVSVILTNGVASSSAVIASGTCE